MIKEIHDGEHARNNYPIGDDGRRRSTASTKSTPSTYPEIAANTALVLIAAATSLLDRQIAAQSAALKAQGGFTEKMYRVRTERRKRQKSPKKFDEYMIHPPCNAGRITANLEPFLGSFKKIEVQGCNRSKDACLDLAKNLAGCGDGPEDLSFDKKRPRNY